MHVKVTQAEEGGLAIVNTLGPLDWRYLYIYFGYYFISL